MCKMPKKKTSLWFVVDIFSIFFSIFVVLFSADCILMNDDTIQSGYTVSFSVGYVIAH